MTPGIKDAVKIAVSAAALAAVYGAAESLAPRHSLACLAIAAAALILFAIAKAYRQVISRIDTARKAEAVQRRQDFHHLEALLSLHQTLQPVAPLPATRGWAAAPDFLKLVAETVLREKPAVVVEASSGASTLIIAYCLQRLGRGKVVSLEHEAEYATKTRAAVALHGLEAFAEVVDAPLCDVTLNGAVWRWYDTAGLQLDGPIDLLVVDGPPGTIQREARYPALPVLRDRLAPGAIALLDDARRRDEQAIVARWVREFPGLRSEFVELEKGAAIVYNGG